MNKSEWAAWKADRVTKAFLQALSDEAAEALSALADIEATPDMSALRYQQGIRDALARVSESPDDFMEITDDE